MCPSINPANAGTTSQLISAADLQLFHLVDNAEEAWQILVQAFALDAPETETGEFADDI